MATAMHRLRKTQVYSAARLNHRFHLSPIDALIDLVVGCRLRCPIPVRLDFDTLTHLHITVIPQRRLASRGYYRGSSESTLMCPSILLICAHSVMNATRRIWLEPMHKLTL